MVAAEVRREKREDREGGEACGTGLRKLACGVRGREYLEMENRCCV